MYNSVCSCCALRVCYCYAKEYKITTLPLCTALSWAKLSGSKLTASRHAFVVQRIAFSPDSKNLYSGGLWVDLLDNSGTRPVLNLWDATTGRWRDTITSGYAPELYAGTSGRKPVIAVGDSDYIRVFDGLRGRLLRATRPPDMADKEDTGVLRAWDISPDGETVLFSLQKRHRTHAFFWRWRSRLPPRRFDLEFSVPADFGATAVFSPTGRDIFLAERLSKHVGHAQLRISRWRPPGLPVKNYVLLPWGFWPQWTQFSTDRSLLAISGDLRLADKQIEFYEGPVRRQFVLMWDVRRKRARLIRCSRSRSRFKVAFSRNDRILAIAELTRVRLLDLKTGCNLRLIYARRHGFRAFAECAFSPDGSHLAVGGLGPKKILIFKLNGGRKP